ncbi:MAG: hypothetical protein ACTHU0_23035, partial [Kofleriaceae bacterium]
MTRRKRPPTEPPDDPPDEDLDDEAGHYPPPQFAPSAVRTPRSTPTPKPAPTPTPTPASASRATPAPTATPKPAPAPAAEPTATPEPAATPGAVAVEPDAAPEPTSAPADEPLLPATYHPNDLRVAVGAAAMPEHIAPPRFAPRPRHDDDDGDDDEADDDDLGPRRPRNRKLILVGAATAVAGLGIAALVVLGRINRERFVFACEPERVVAEQGRSFPPWGTHALEGAPWKPIAIPPNAECKEQELDSLAELSARYHDMLVARASALLTEREVTKVDAASAMLDQALLHARSPERRAQRQEIERLLGDVGYWRASAKLRDAAAALAEAANQFDAAALQRPRHVTDAAAWAAYARKLADELRAGPSGAAVTTFPPAPPERPRAPEGVALPVDLGPGPGPGAGTGGGAGSDTGSAGDPADPA